MGLFATLLEKIGIRSRPQAESPVEPIAVNHIPERQPGVTQEEKPVSQQVVSESKPVSIPEPVVPESKPEPTPLASPEQKLAPAIAKQREPVDPAETEKIVRSSLSSSLEAIRAQARFVCDFAPDSEALAPLRSQTASLDVRLEQVRKAS